MIVLTIISIYLALLLGLGLFSNRLFRGTSEDYMLASHSIGPFLLLMSLFGTTMTAFALVGSSGEAYKEGIGVYGMLASSSGIIHSFCFFIIGIKLWALGRKYGYTTQIQFFRDRLESEHIGLVLFPILVGLVIPYLLIGVMASGTVIQNVTMGTFPEGMAFFAPYDYGVPKWLGSLVISIVVLLYVFFGGMRGTAWANAFQTCVFMVLGLVTFFLIAGKLGGLEAASEKVMEKHPSKLMRTVTEGETESYEQEFQRWVTLAKYRWAERNDKVNLHPDQLAEIHAAVDQKPGPPWKKPFDKIVAEANYAQENNLLNLTAEETQIAKLEQDDRYIPPENLREPGWEKLPLTDGNFPRNSTWPREALKRFGDKIAHPKAALKDPTLMTRAQALGRYRALHWAPEEPHSMDKLVFFTYLLIPLSVGMFPHLFQHWLTAKSADSFKLPVVAHPLFIMIVWVPCVLVGVWATSAAMPGNPNVPLVPPHFNPNGVLAYLVNRMTGDVLTGFLTAGILAAIMSSLDSQFLCIGTIFTNDIVLHYGGEKRFTDKQQVVLARTFIVLIVAITYGLSLFEPRRVFTLGVWCFSGFASLFPIVFAAVYWKRLTAAGAYAGALAAIVSWCVLFAQSKYGLDADYAFLGMMPVVTIFTCATVAMVLVSLITKPPSDHTIEKFFEKIPV